MPPSLPHSHLPGDKDYFAYMLFIKNLLTDIHTIRLGIAQPYNQDYMGHLVQHYKTYPWSSLLPETRLLF